MNTVITPSPAFTHQPPSDDTLAMLACLRTAVAEALERKRKLGQYWVEWSTEGPRLVGPDAPQDSAIMTMSHPEAIAK